MPKHTYEALDDERLSEAVVRALAAVSETKPETVQPLYDSIDPDGLDALFRGRATSGRIVFDHAGYRVTARSTGVISLHGENQE